jgi:hypothetical protein
MKNGDFAYNRTMIFKLADHQRVARGEFTVTYRLWKSPHVKKGATYRSGFGGAYHILDVSLVRAGDISDKDARAAGSTDRQALLKLAGEHTRIKVTPSMKLYRVSFRYVDKEPKRETLGVDEVLSRLARLDKAKPWTEMALTLIERNPRVVARELAGEAGFDTLDFKVNIRKLKKLGLTTSLDIGYELTPLGQDTLDRMRA